MANIQEAFQSLGVASGQGALEQGLDEYEYSLLQSLGPYS